MSILVDIWTAGIDFSLAGNGGPHCIETTSMGFRVLEMLLAWLVSFAAVVVGLRGHGSLKAVAARWPTSSSLLRKLFLASLLFSLLMEVGYKVFTRQLIFIFNPCHILCMTQMYLLSDFHWAPFLKNYIFGIHLFFLHGPVLACLFPTTNTRFLPGETANYWVEHCLLLLIPVFLLTHYTIPYMEFQQLLYWSLLSYGVWGLFHYFLLFPLALWTEGNLGNMLCPAFSDPIGGPYYRLHAFWHQYVAVFASGALFFVLSLLKGQHCRQ